MSGERPFECNVCHARFTLKHSMMRHRRKHEGLGNVDAGEPQSDSDTEVALSSGELKNFSR